MRQSIICLLVLVGGPLAESCAGDDGVFSLVVRRDYNYWLGRGVDQHVYVNGKHLGGISNGSQVRFAVPVSASGKYKVKIGTWDSLLSPEKQFNALPGEEVHVICGVDSAWVDGNSIRSVAVFPLAAPELTIFSPRAAKIVINKTAYNFAAGKSTIKTVDKTNTKRFLRLTCETVKEDGQKERFVIFGQPGRMVWLNLHGADSLDSAARTIASAQYLVHVRNATLHNLGTGYEDISNALDDLIADLQGIPTAGVKAELLEFQKSNLAYFRELQRLTNSSPLKKAAVNLGATALQTACEVIITQQAPSRAEMLVTGVVAVLEGTYDVYQLRSKLADVHAALRSTEMAAVQSLRKDLAQHPGLENHLAIVAAIGQKSIAKNDLLGKWSFVQKTPTREARYSYTFRENGVIIQTAYGAKKETTTSNGTYEFNRGTLMIKWRNSSEEGEINHIDQDRLTYVIRRHSADADQVGTEMLFERQSKR